MLQISENAATAHQENDRQERHSRRRPPHRHQGRRLFRAELHVRLGSRRRATATTCSKAPTARRCSSIRKSYQFIDGTTLDYDTSLVSKGFIFNNPNAKSHLRVRDVVSACDARSSRSSLSQPR